MKLRWEDTIEDRARAVVECWIEDCGDASGDSLMLTMVQESLLRRQIEVAIHAQRHEYHVEDQ